MRASVSEELAFRFQDGRVVRDLAALREALAAARPETVHFHREHFVPWVRDVLGEAPLARRLEAYAAAGAAPDVYRDIALALVTRAMAERGPPSP